jgi:hypothetical protein
MITLMATFMALALLMNIAGALSPVMPSKADD